MAKDISQILNDDKFSDSDGNCLMQVIEELARYHKGKIMLGVILSCLKDNYSDDLYAYREDCVRDVFNAVYRKYSGAIADVGLSTDLTPVKGEKIFKEFNNMDAGAKNEIRDWLYETSIGHLNDLIWNCDIEVAKYISGMLIDMLDKCLYYAKKKYENYEKYLRDEATSDLKIILKTIFNSIDGRTVDISLFFKNIKEEDKRLNGFE